MSFVKTICLLLSFFCFRQLHAQEKSTVSGRVLTAGKPLAGATITFTRLADHSRLASITSNADGRFTVHALPQKDSLVLEISFIGYVPYRGLLLLHEKRFATAAVTLDPQSEQMDTVVVTAERLVAVKGDTIEFNASAIKTPPNSVAAELLKRIPGLSLTVDGKLSFNGRPVTKVMVDGKTFFSDDGGIALNNIPADMIDRVQFINDAPKGIGDVETDPNQVLNLKLKPGRKYFGNTVTAAGTDERYNGSLFGSYMVGKSRFGLTFGRNNINQAAGNSIQLATAGSGITRTTAASIDYNRDYTGNHSLGTNYSFSVPSTIKESLLQRRQDILSSTVLITNSRQSMIKSGNNHAGSIRYQARGGKKRTIMASAFLNYGTVNGITKNSMATTDGQGHLLNTLSGAYNSRGRNLISSSAANGTEFFKKKGRTLEWDLNFNYRSINNIDHNEAQTVFYKNNLLDSQYHFSQELENKDQLVIVNAGMRYTGRLGKNTSFGLRDSWNKQWGRSDRKTWSLDSLGHKIGIDSLYSNALTSNAVSNVTELSIGYQKKYWFINGGVSLIQNLTQQEDAVKKTEIMQRTASPAVNSSIKYSGKKMVWSIATGANYILPALEQLQPVSDVTNPLFIVEGNPSLRPQFFYKNSIGWKNKKLQVNGRPAAIFNSIDISWNTIHDKIVNSIYYDTLGKQRTSYQNVNCTYNFGGRLQFSCQRKWGAQLFSINLVPGFSFQKDKVFINGQLYGSERTSIQSSLNINYQNSDLISFVVVYAPSFNSMHYQQNSSMDQFYVLHSLKMNLDLYLMKRVKMMHSLDYTYNNSLPPGYARSSLLWNTSASFICLKNKKGELSFMGFDILRQFNNLVRTIGSNYIEDTQTNNLQRYFLAGFKYFFGKINSK